MDENEYLHDPEQTRKKFLPDQLAAGGRMYCTGDYGRLSSRGLLTIEGRISGDTQVKLRGFRIELTEIERVMVKEGGLVHAVVTLRDDSFLASHVVFQPEKQNYSSDLISKLRARLPLCLPPYMCPSIIVPLREMPLTAHSKIDRKAVQEMPLPEITTSTTTLEESSLTPTERRLAGLWATVLPTHALSNPLGPRSNFFQLGGNSLLLVSLQAVMENSFGDAPRLSKLMGVGELGSMAALLDDGITCIDWNQEIALDGFTQSAKTDNMPAEINQKGFNILITGATGSLGRHIVPRLAANEGITEVICLVRPAPERNMMCLFQHFEGIEKVRVVEADLPFLPDDSEIGRIDFVLHCAANRSFWDGYKAVKPVNVEGAKALAKLCLRSGASLHVLSSGAVSIYEGEAQPNPADGYVATKWVAEKVLARLAVEQGLLITAHRPTNVVDANHKTALSCDGEARKINIEESMARGMLNVSKNLNMRPDFARLGGTLDVTRVEEVANAITATVIRDLDLTIGKSSLTEPHKMRVVPHPGKVKLQTEVLGRCLDNLLLTEENSEIRRLPAVPALHWVGLAKKAGLFEWFITAMDLTISDQEGRMIVTRR